MLVFFWCLLVRLSKFGSNPTVTTITNAWIELGVLHVRPNLFISQNLSEWWNWLLKVLRGREVLRRRRKYFMISDHVKCQSISLCKYHWNYNLTDILHNQKLGVFPKTKDEFDGSAQPFLRQIWPFTLKICVIISISDSLYIVQGKEMPQMATFWFMPMED